jgi:hypothetical protein
MADTDKTSATASELQKPAPHDRIQIRFENFHRQNPRFYQLLVYYTREAVKAREEKGRSRHYGIAAAVERVRWHVDVESRRASRSSRCPTTFGVALRAAHHETRARLARRLRPCASFEPIQTVERRPERN